MSPLKTTFIGALMAFSPMALKAQTSAQVFNTNKESITNVMNTAVVNDNTDPENTFPTGGYDTETGKYTSGVVINDYATTYAKKMTANFNGIALAFSVASENIDYAVSMGEDVKGALENAGIPFEYFISADASSGLSVSAYGGKGSSASVSLKNDGEDTRFC